MKYLIGLAGCLLLIISGVLPIATINNVPVTIFPVFENFNIADNIWVWNDISAFSVTFGIVALLAIYFVLKGIKLAIIISGAIILVVSFFMLISVWMSSFKVEKFQGMEFSYGYSWLILIAGAALILFYGIKKKKSA